MISLGADPEWEALDCEGQLVPASTFLEDIDHDEPIGLDGDTRTGEFRPEPTARSPEALVNEIDRLINETYSIIPPEIEIYGGAGKHVPLGGHIHFGGISPCHFSKLISALDFYLALPLMLIEEYNSAINRRRDGYGKLSDINEQPWGFEYRTPSSWLVDRESAMETLALSYMLGLAAVNDCLPPFQEVITHEDYENIDKEHFKENGDLNIITRGWQRLPLFDKYKSILGRLATKIVYGAAWKVDRPIRVGWGIKRPKKPSCWIPGRDNLIAEIIALLKKEGILPTQPIYLYGLNDKHKIDIALDHPPPGLYSIKVPKDKKIEIGQAFGSARYHSPERGFAIGLSRNCRKSPERAVEIIHALLKGLGVLFNG